MRAKYHENTSWHNGISWSGDFRNRSYLSAVVVVVVVIEFTIPARILPHRAVSLSDLRHRGRDSSVPCAAIAASRTLGGLGRQGDAANRLFDRPRAARARIASHRFSDYDNDNARDCLRRLTDFRLATPLFG
jgi:hypothetical protein